MKHLTYGEGRIKTNKGSWQGLKCLTLLDTGVARDVGTTSNEGPSLDDPSCFDVILSFKNIEGARLLQDMLNELVCEWSREESPKVDSL